MHQAMVKVQENTGNYKFGNDLTQPLNIRLKLRLPQKGEHCMCASFQNLGVA